MFMIFCYEYVLITSPLLDIIINNFTVTPLYFHQIQCTHNCSPDSYTTALILNIIALAQFFNDFLLWNIFNKLYCNTLYFTNSVHNITALPADYTTTHIFESNCFGYIFLWIFNLRNC